MNRTIYGFKYENYNDSSCNSVDDNVFYHENKRNLFMEAVMEEMFRELDAEHAHKLVVQEARGFEPFMVIVVNKKTLQKVEALVATEFVLQDEPNLDD